MNREFSLFRLFWRLLGMAGMLVLMLAIAGTGVLAVQAISIWSFGSLRPGTTVRQSAAQTQLAQFRDAVQLYAKHNGRPPSTAQGLNALICVPALEPRPKHWRKYLQDLDEIPKDPWGSDYVYQSPGPHRESFLITSYGADSRSGGTGLNADITGGPTNGSSGKGDQR